MNYLQIVQKAMYRSGLRSESPTTLLNALDITLDFTNWAQDSWRELQEESINWWFRQKLDQTFPLVASQDEYVMPTNLETLNKRTITLYDTAQGVDEVNLVNMRYEDWRIERDTVDTAEGRPTHLTISPTNQIFVWPVPDKAYTLRFDGVWDIDEMLLDADTPGSNISGGTLLPDRYQWVLVYDTMRRYAEHHEDAQGIEKAQSKYLAQHARLTEKQMPPVFVPAGVLTGLGSHTRRLW